ncbi:MAG TPA: hypothetical protein VIR98_03075 [Candidatus Paceibacterota bacterium]
MGSVESVSPKRIDWKQIDYFVSIVVKLSSSITETCRKAKIGPECLEWFAGEGRKDFEEFLARFVWWYALRNKDLGRSWSKICKVSDSNLRMALSTVDLTTHLGKRLIAAFPECFCSAGAEETGPVPLSVLQQHARYHNKIHRLGHHNPEEKLVFTQSVKHHGIPFFWACWSPNYPDYNPDWVLLTKHHQAKFGDILDVAGAKYFVVQCELGKHGEKECCLVPLGCIDPEK